MRTMVLAELDTVTSNALINDGTIGATVEEILGKLQPEAAYFYNRGGRRAFTLVVDIPDPTYIPLVLEPLWLRLNAHVESFSCMTADELATGLGRLG